MIAENDGKLQEKMKNIWLFEKKDIILPLFLAVNRIKRHF